MKGRGKRRDYRAPEDLLGEAMLQILSGKRIWQKNACSLRQLIVGTMRSTRSHWRRKASKKPWPDPDIASNGDADPVEWEEISGNILEPWQRLANEEGRQATVQWFEELARQFRGDATVSLLFHGMRKGWPASRLIRRIGYGTYKIAMERLYRRARERNPAAKKYFRFRAGVAQNVGIRPIGKRTHAPGGEKWPDRIELLTDKDLPRRNLRRREPQLPACRGTKSVP